MALLEAKQLSKEFFSGQEKILVLDQINLRIDPGSIIAITGPSGSGKSTLLGLLSGLDVPTQGQIFLDEVDLNTMNESDIADIRLKKIGFIFQSYRLLPTLTAIENVKVPLELAGDSSAEEKAMHWLSEVGLKDRQSHLPNQLSGGEQQRVALARAMVHQPEILFADEPIGNLDQKTGAEMGDLLFRLMQTNQTSMVLVTHESSLADRAQKIYHLSDSQLILKS